MSINEKDNYKRAFEKLNKWLLDYQYDVARYASANHWGEEQLAKRECIHLTLSKIVQLLGWAEQVEKTFPTSLPNWGWF